MSINKLSTRNIIGFTLTLLLVIQLFAVPLIPLLTKSNYELYTHYVYAYLIFSYFAITAIISLEFRNLSEFHIDHLTLWLVIFSCFVRSRLSVKAEIIYLLPIMLFGFVNILQIIQNHFSIPRTHKKAFLGGTILACTALAITTIVESFQARNWLTPIYSTNIGINFVRQLVFQLSFVVLIEETVFRGFFAGYLIKIGFKEKTAFTIQALLFWLTHYMRSGNIITFFISIPVLTLSTSLVVKYYKQLFPAIIIHTFVNVFVSLLINIWF